MSIDNNNNILLCACKKYIKGQKNGILLISDLKSIDDSYYDSKNNIKFYNTINFEVHCFCQISIVNKTNILREPEIKKTNYFFVGGFDIKRHRGGIKLYKFKKNKEEIIEIEEIQDIVLENVCLSNKNKKSKFKFCKGPISCIKQTTNQGEILITCWDGNVYLFNIPLFENFMAFEKYKDLI